MNTLDSGFVRSIMRPACAGLLALLIVGCNSEKPAADAEPEALPPVDADASTTSAASKTGPPVSAEEATEFAKEWEAAAQAGNGQQASLIDIDTILRRALAGFDVDEKFKTGLIKGAKAGRPIATILTQLGQNEQAGGSYRLVRVALRGGQQHAVFRMTGADGTLNYHDLRIVRSAGARLHADQFFVALTGEALADTLRTNVTPAVNAHRSKLGRLLGSEADTWPEKIGPMMQLVRAGRFQEARDMYDQLSAEGKANKSAQLCRLMASMDLAPEKYLAVMDEYAKQFPNDPSLGLVLLDAAALRKDAAQLEKAYAALRDWTGGDPYLDLMVAGLLSTLDKVDRAREMVAGVDIDALGMADAHDFALSVALAADDHEQTLTQLRTLRDRYGYDFIDLSQAEGFEKFAKSPSFATWQTEQAANRQK